jgi:RNA polymerase sigma-70 factor (ECF subfamily)
MEAFFEMYYARLCYFAQKLTGNHKEEAEDIAQEALMSLWINVKDKGVLPLNVQAYLFQTVRNRCYNYNKREKMKEQKAAHLRQLHPLSENAIEQALMQEDIFNKIYIHIQSLPPRYAEILKLSFVDELDTNEIAEQLQLTPNNIRNIKARALEKIRLLLAGKELLVLFVMLFLFFYKFFVMK